jgi:hypothetical protein
VQVQLELEALRVVGTVFHVFQCTTLLVHYVKRKMQESKELCRGSV